MKHCSPSSIDLKLVTPLGEVAGEGVGEGPDVGEGDKIVPKAVPARIKETRYQMSSPHKRRLKVGAVVQVAFWLDGQTLDKMT